MTKKQHYMRWEERQQLEAMRRNHIPVSEIARQLGFCRQTIYDELKRGAYIHVPILGRSTLFGGQGPAGTRLQPDRQGAAAEDRQ